MKQSHPPSSSPSAVARKYAPRPRRGVIVPKGSSGLPSGPIEPATNALTPDDLARGARATLTPCRAIRRTFVLEPVSARAARALAPKVLVSIELGPGRQVVAVDRTPPASGARG